MLQPQAIVTKEVNSFFVQSSSLVWSNLSPNYCQSANDFFTGIIISISLGSLASVGKGCARSYRVCQWVWNFDNYRNNRRAFELLQRVTHSYAKIARDLSTAMAIWEKGKKADAAWPQGGVRELWRGRESKKSTLSNHNGVTCSIRGSLTRVVFGLAPSKILDNALASVSAHASTLLPRPNYSNWHMVLHISQ